MFDLWDEPWYTAARPYMRRRLPSQTYAELQTSTRIPVLICGESEHGQMAGPHGKIAVQSAFARRKMFDFRSPCLTVVRRLHLRAKGASR